MLSNSGINKVLLLGQITDEPFKNQSSKSIDYLCIRLLTTENIKKGNESAEHNEYHNIKIPEKLITQEALYLAPGQTLYIEGKIQTTSFTDEMRIKRYNLEILANKVEIVNPMPLVA